MKLSQQLLINSESQFLGDSVLATTNDQRKLLQEWMGMPNIKSKRLILGSKDGFKKEIY
jgi:hypothetical protein